MIPHFDTPDCIDARPYVDGMGFLWVGPVYGQHDLFHFALFDGADENGDAIWLWCEEEVRDDWDEIPFARYIACLEEYGVRIPGR